MRILHQVFGRTDKDETISHRLRNDLRTGIIVVSYFGVTDMQRGEASAQRLFPVPRRLGTLQDPREDGLPTTRVLIPKISLVLAVLSNCPFDHCGRTHDGEDTT